jgi:hypothetical protein
MLKKSSQIPGSNIGMFIAQNNCDEIKYYKKCEKKEATSNSK